MSHEGTARRPREKLQALWPGVLAPAWWVVAVALSVCAWSASPQRVAPDSPSAQTAPKPCRPSPSQACGAAAVDELARLYGRPLQDSAAKRLVARFKNRQMSLLEMRTELRKMGLVTKGVAGTYDDLRVLNRPFVARVITDSEPHFVVVHSLGGDWLVIGEGKQVQIVDARWFRKVFAGQALVPWFPGDSLELPRKPSLSADPEVRAIHLGSDELADSVVTLRNLGTTGDVQVTRIELPAGWETQPCAFPFTIRAGQSYGLELRQAALREKTGKSDEAQTAGVFVHSDDPVRPILTVALKVDRTRRLTVYDSKIDFGEGEQETLVGRSRSIYVHYRGEAGRLYVEPGDQWLHADLVKEVYHETSTWKDSSVDAIIELRIDDASCLPTGAGKTDLHIAVLTEGAPDGYGSGGSGDEVSIPVQVTLLGKVRAEPPGLFLGILEPGAVANQSVSIVGADPGDITISRGATEPGFRIEVVRGAGPDAAAELRCSVQADLLREGITEGEVVLTLGAGGQKELVIPYFVYLRR